VLTSLTRIVLDLAIELIPLYLEAVVIGELD